MNHLKKNQPLVITLVQQFKNKGYSCRQVKEKEATLTILTHGKRIDPINNLIQNY